MFYKEFIEVWYKVTTLGYDTSLYQKYYKGRQGLRPLQEHGRCYVSSPPPTPKETIYIIFMCIFLITSLVLGYIVYLYANKPVYDKEDKPVYDKEDKPVYDKEDKPVYDKPVSSDDKPVSSDDKPVSSEDVEKYLNNTV